MNAQSSMAKWPFSILGRSSCVLARRRQAIIQWVISKVKAACKQAAIHPEKEEECLPNCEEDGSSTSEPAATFKLARSNAPMSIQQEVSSVILVCLLWMNPSCAHLVSTLTAAIRLKQMTESTWRACHYCLVLLCSLAHKWPHCPCDSHCCEKSTHSIIISIIVGHKITATRK